MIHQAHAHHIICTGTIELETNGLDELTDVCAGERTMGKTT